MDGCFVSIRTPCGSWDGGLHPYSPAAETNDDKIVTLGTEAEAKARGKNLLGL